MVSDGRDINWASVLRADFTMKVESLQQYAYAAGARRDVSLQRQYLHRVAQLEALPKPWEGGARLTEEEYAAAVRVRAWVLHEQEIADDLLWAKNRRMSAQQLALREAKFRAKKRYHRTSDGQMLCAALRDDGRIALNSEILGPEVADRLRQQMPQLAHLITFYLDNQEAGRGLQGAPIDRTPLPGPASPSPEPPVADGALATAQSGGRDGTPQRPAAPAKRWRWWRRRRP
ncbi:hypothetical protein [Streptomyces sp. NBC_00576]|uniref:hypothetical protein n=1 Tax=Streptomyces sp. NBC_00576 TaxID=2903665 RepID=UPI002E816C3D|nr:hypothetical protein [Streptomyces sp. NBC_00576]WUB73808.1 hypothetical protein OG734_29145 [Streptomyces sp. NBC_00576]